VKGRDKILKCDFFNYISIKNHKKWEIKKIEMLQNKAYNILRILYGVSPPHPVYYTDSGFDNDHSEDRHSAAAQCCPLTTIARI
jgi:hypothetical protein